MRSQFLRLAGTLVAFNVRSFEREMDRTYSRVSTPREAEAAAEALLRQWFIRQSLLTFLHLASRAPQADAKQASPTWLPERLASRVRVLFGRVDAFNHWKPPQPGAMPIALVHLTENAATPNFNRAFGDSRIPAPIRLGYYAHWTTLLHVIVLARVDRGKLPNAIVEPVTSALEVSLRRALGLALGLPGRVDGEDVGFEDVEIIDIDDEQAAWSRYLRSTDQDSNA